MNKGMLSSKLEYLNYLCGFISDNKRQKFEELVCQRTRIITVVLEDIFQPHNASAVLRTCDCFGIQDVHIIENENRYRINPDVALGSYKWLTITKYNRAKHNTAECLLSLKKAGYDIVATCLHQDDYSLDDLPFEQKTALVFGNELNGLTDEALRLADRFVKIPMVGFTESLNISVSAAIFLYHLTKKMRNSWQGWHLTPKEQTEIKIAWASSVVQHVDLLKKEFLKTHDTF
jgi:tRNA (guanosine-2'-O-)-methyltransferase